MNLIIIHCVILVIKTTCSQNEDSYDLSQTQEDDYDDSKTHYHHRHHKKHRKNDANYPVNHAMPAMSPVPAAPYVNGYDYTYNEDDCDCTCDKCAVVKPCCRDFCMHCQAMNQPNMYYVPYPVPPYPVAPYPVIMPNSTKPEEIITTPTTITQASTTTATTTTTTTTTPSPPPSKTSTVTISSTVPYAASDTRREAVIEVSDIYINDNLNRNNDAKYILTSLRRTKPYWQANGVVPIPNNLAEKLMTQMKDDTKQSRRVFRSYQP